MMDLSKIEACRESNRLEAKLAAGGLPESLWETYSAFANTDGGYILLGVRENPDHSLEIAGLADPEGMIEQLWQALNDPEQVGVNILTLQDLYILEEEGRRVVVMEVPAATPRQKPVYVGPYVAAGHLQAQRRGGLPLRAGGSAPDAERKRAAEPPRALRTLFGTAAPGLFRPDRKRS